MAGAVAKHILPQPDAHGKLEGLPAVQDAGDSRERREGAGRDGEVEVLDLEGRLHGVPVQERPHDRADVRAADKAMLPVIQSSAAKIGITFKVRSVNGAYPVDPDGVEEQPDL